MARKILGVLGGEDMPATRIRAWADSADEIIAADRGALQLLAAGIVPHRVIGDFDSVVAGALPSQVVVHHEFDQSTTDCDKLLAFATDEGHRAITLMGVEGDRLDHVIASIGSAAIAKLCVRLILRMGMAWVVRPDSPAKVLATIGSTVSLLPIVECRHVSASGLKWPVQEATLSPLGFRSISNMAIHEVVHVAIGSGALLLTVEHGTEHEPAW